MENRMKNEWQNQKILVAGMGGSGISMLDFLRRKGAVVAAYDADFPAAKQAELQQRFPGLACHTGYLKNALAEGFDILALSPGISERTPEIEAFKQAGGRVLGDVEILAHELAGKRDKIIAITGSNGKTTVTSLVGHLCRECGLDTVVAGNIGTPVLEAYEGRQEQSADVWVLELSSFQLENTDHLNAAAAAVLNISEDHLNRYDDLLDYAHAKDKIFRGSGVQVINADDALCRAMKRSGREVRRFSLEKIGEKNGVVFIDDSKGTNVGATEAAIAGLQSPLFLIAGGQGKGQDFTPLKNVLPGKARAVLLIGEDAPQIRRDLADCGVEMLDCASLQEAVQTAYRLAEPGDIVLLSPACASFDMFKGYAHRSQVFIEAFEAL